MSRASAAYTFRPESGVAAAPISARCPRTTLSSTGGSTAVFIGAGCHAERNSGATMC
jgi:hypothetical protein